MKQRNIQMLCVVARGLGSLKKDVVFLGGATVGLHIDDPAAPEVRPTKDVDCVVELASRLHYYKLEDNLRKLGFKQPMEGDNPICRWAHGGVLVDVMPTDEKILGFSNRWYKEGIAHAQSIQLPDSQTISVFSLPYLVASKLEAFLNRGEDDFFSSPDIEDIVALVDGCKDFKEIVSKAPRLVKSYLKEKFAYLVANERFSEAVHTHIESTGFRGGRVERALSIFKELAT